VYTRGDGDRCGNSCTDDRRNHHLQAIVGATVAATAAPIVGATVGAIEVTFQPKNSSALCTGDVVTFAP